MRVFGNLMNRVMEDCEPPIPEVGMGATILMHSDRHACTVIEVSSDKKRIVIQRDTASRIYANGMSDNQQWEYAADANGVKRIFTLRQSGRWVEKGRGEKNGTIIRLGARDEHYDSSF